MINIYAKGLSIGIKDPFKNKTSVEVNLFTEDFCTEFNSSTFQKLIFIISTSCHNELIVVSCGRESVTWSGGCWFDWIQNGRIL